MFICNHPADEYIDYMALYGTPGAPEAVETRPAADANLKPVLSQAS